MSDPPAQTPLDLKMSRAVGWLQSHLLNHAEITLREVLAEDPKRPMATRMHGIALFKLGRRDEGLAALQAGVIEEADNPRAWADLAVALRDSGQVQAAEEAYAKGLALSQNAGALPLGDAVFCIEHGFHDFTLLDYPYHAHVRYGAGRPAHPELAALIGAGRKQYRAVLDLWGPLQPDFADVPLGGTYETLTPFWFNSWFSPLDAIALTGMLRTENPRLMVEIGSGVSTKYARRAVARYGLRTRLVSIDPQPRNQIDQLCDQVIRKPLEQCSTDMFDVLEPGDIFFLDSSHRSFQGSDVTVFFLEILPRLKPGVIVHIHDIYLPYDYIAGHVPRMWNEQYLLAAALLFGPQRFEILFPSWFVGRDPDLMAHAEALFRKGPMESVDLYGASFWMRMT
ncbi:class I SAM-dependent methyltransferase [Phenylobacterium sp.]|uniref:class I SAM-dependent methyltransferase n=1 Tax=Phenylobacterium sp. TaxID=1871053 RepID=UPI002C28DA08|nr:class I SAM-dependent methyltransferase [Phenylobacterium sp.]HLZ76069.1 class I SAM-dependent methyltransferase [Phenylobacterium sp.]